MELYIIIFALGMIFAIGVSALAGWIEKKRWKTTAAQLTKILRNKETNQWEKEKEE